MIVDLFAGAGGWAAGMHSLGVNPSDTVAVEWDKHAHATHVAAGFPALGPDAAGDVAELDPHTVAPDGADGLIASPPCQAFSMAGKGAGRDAIGGLLTHIMRCADGWVEPTGDLCSEDIRADLTLQPLRWVDALRPRWVALEQVPPVLDAWQAMAHVLRGWGYTSAVGVLSSEEYGVPQTRRRAILVARRDGVPAELPTPSHTKYDHRSVNGGRAPMPPLFGGELLPWVSMADAIGWGMPDRPFYTYAGVSAHAVGDREFGGSSVREDLAERAASGDPQRWTIDAGRDVSRDEASQPVRLSVAQAAALQTFPHDWPWQGTRTAQYRQIGNAVPARLAAAILAPLLARPKIIQDRT
jgi:DNA (cytosine-5)-methyltransferase 1